MAISSSKSCPKCGDNHKGKPFALYEDGWHCFSCGSSKRAIRNFTLRKLEAQGDIELPELTLNPSLFSLPVLKWLRGYHVTDDLIYKYSIAETKDNSIITPVISPNDGKVVMYQRRWFDPRRIMTYGNKQPFIVSSLGNFKTLVIVEDFISSIRVGEIVDCYCMFGTSIHYQRLSDLVKTYDTIIIWADGDGPGQRAAIKLSELLNKLIYQETRKRSFALLKKIVRNVSTEYDPKCYTNTEIRTILQQKIELEVLNVKIFQANG